MVSWRRAGILIICLYVVKCWADEHDHGGVSMGAQYGCDDGQTGIEIDWNPLSEKEHTCYPGESRVPDTNYLAREWCEREAKSPYHICMDEEIIYNETIPVSGRHRPVWPAYGTYRYIPPQRWLHSLEHGAVVLLYHPCANKEDIKVLKTLLRGCIRRHIITPYKKLSPYKPFALVAWKCKLVMADADVNAAVQFIMNHAGHGPEPNVYADGDYSIAITQPAQVVSDVQDSLKCPLLQ